MQFKGTKGKWKVDSYDNTLVRPDIRYTNEGICRCFSRNYTGNKFEDEANAKLISKAPEMLEKLISILNMSEDKGVAGCTWGDTEMSSTDVAYGYNLALENVKSGLEELIKSATKI